MTPDAIADFLPSYKPYNPSDKTNVASIVETDFLPFYTIRRNAAVCCYIYIP